MPLYEYQCTKCGHRFERIQSFSAENVKQCPVCQGEVERLISAPAVHFKGSGFYSTDYGAKPSAGTQRDSDGASGKPAAPDGAASPAEKSSSAKSETVSSSAPAEKRSKSEKGSKAESSKSDSKSAS